MTLLSFLPFGAVIYLVRPETKVGDKGPFSPYGLKKNAVPKSPLLIRAKYPSSMDVFPGGFDRWRGHFLA